MQFHMDLETLAKITASAGIIVAFVMKIREVCALCKKICKWLWKWGANMIQGPMVLERIEKELKTNGGSSLRDAVNQILLNQDMDNQKLLTIVDEPGKGVFQTNVVGEYILTSLGYDHMLGRSSSESMGNNWIQNISSIDRDSVFLAWRQSIEQKRIFDASFKMIGVSGSEFFVRVKATPLKDAKGEIKGWFGVVKKI